MNELQVVVSFIEMMKEIDKTFVNNEKGYAIIHNVEEVYYLYAIKMTDNFAYNIEQDGFLVNKKPLLATEVVAFFTSNQVKMLVTV